MYSITSKPWSPDPEGFAVIAKNGETVASVLPLTNGRGGRPSKDRVVERKANVAMLAAAPELHDALKMALPYLPKAEKAVAEAVLAKVDRV